MSVVVDTIVSENAAGRRFTTHVSYDPERDKYTRALASISDESDGQIVLYIDEIPRVVAALLKIQEMDQARKSAPDTQSVTEVSQ